MPTILSFVLSRKIEFDEKQIETFLSNYKYFSGQSSNLFSLLEDSKNHYRTEIISVCNADLAKIIYLGFGKPEFFNAHTFTWYKVHYLTYSSIFEASGFY